MIKHKPLPFKQMTPKTCSLVCLANLFNDESTLVQDLFYPNGMNIIDEIAVINTHPDWAGITMYNCYKIPDGLDPIPTEHIEAVFDQHTDNLTKGKNCTIIGLEVKPFSSDEHHMHHRVYVIVEKLSVKKRRYYLVDTATSHILQSDNISDIVDIYYGEVYAISLFITKVDGTWYEVLFEKEHLKHLI